MTVFDTVVSRPAHEMEVSEMSEMEIEEVVMIETG